jgi:Flp pilus assembly protein TadG
VTVRPQRDRRRTGTTIVEVALVLSLFLMLVFGLCEYGRYVMTRQLLEHAAREGARYAVVHTYDATTTDIQDHVDSVLAGQGRQLEGYNKYSSISVFESDPITGENLGAWTNAKFGDDITVRVEGDYRPILPAFLLMPELIRLHGECSMKSEAN